LQEVKLALHRQEFFLELSDDFLFLSQPVNHRFERLALG
jgi:hypothetical protein